MTLKEKLLEYCKKYNTPADENLDDYEKIMHSSVYRDAYLAKFSAFKNFLSQKVPSEKLIKFLKDNVVKSNYDNIVNAAKRENVSVFSAYSYYSLFDRINKDELERQKEPNKEPEKDEKSYIDQLCELLPEEYHEEAVQLIENALDPYYWENDKLDTPSLSKEINEIKAELPPQDAEKYKDILDYAEKATFQHKQYNFQSVLAMNANSAAERVQNTKTNAIALEKYGDVIQYTTLTASLTNDVQNPKLQELSKEKGRLSDGYKASLKKAFDIFADIEKDTGIDARAGEQGGKIYGFIGYTEARKKLFDAVRSKNIAEIEKCVTQHQKESLRLEELSKITEELDPSNTAFVGNIDISRNSSIPMKYIKNMPMSSKINTMFMLYSAMKESGLSIDEYLDSPGKAIEDLINKDINDNVDLNFKVRGDNNVNKSISEVLKQFNGKSDLLEHEDMNRPLFNYGIGRSIGAMHVLEPDAEKKQEMIYANARFEIKLSVAGALDNRNRTLFISDKQGAQKAAECSDLLANYFLFDDSTRDYNLLNAKSGYTDPMTFKYVPPFDRQKYIKDHAIDIAAVNDRIMDTLKKMVIDPDFSSESLFTSKKVITNAIKTIAKDILKEKSAVANPADRKILKEFAKNPVAKYKSIKKAEKKAADKYFKKIKSAIKKEESAFEKKFKAANANEREALKEERINSLKASFACGDIPAKYLIERTRQIVHEQFGKLPQVFETDKFPSQKNYIKNMGLNDLSPEERKNVYEAAKERAKHEKEQLYENWNLEQKGKEVVRDDPDDLLRVANIKKFVTESEAVGKDANDYLERVVIDDLENVKNEIGKIEDINIGDKLNTVEEIQL